MNSLVLLIFFVPFVFGFEHEFKGFDDSILFGINWPGSLENVEGIENIGEDKTTKATDILKVQTAGKESYECHIPEVIVNENIKIEDYEGLSPLELLKPLFTQKICSYRLESYWSYEVCHGRFIRQYHEEREGKQIKTQEYYLGHWSAEKQKALEDSLADAKQQQEKPKLAKIHGIGLPSLELVMEDGTLCDLNGKNRLTRVMYVCYSQGKHEVYSFKETSTCEYEIIVLSPLLCEHPQFKPIDASENTINCLPVGDAPTKPRGLLAMEAETLKLQHQSIRLANNDKSAKDVIAVLKVEKIEKDGETHLKFVLDPLEEGEAVTPAPADNLADMADRLADMADRLAVIDDTPVRDFLNGETCLNGGTGWWKYEFCYGRYVAQYHVDRAGQRTSVTLGVFDEQAHLDWVRDNKAKAPKPLEQRTSISHLYSGGDVCDKTGRPRTTEVKLKCPSAAGGAVALYLLEPRTCHYILGVESPLVCALLPLADDTGLVRSANQRDKTAGND